MELRAGYSVVLDLVNDRGLVRDVPRLRDQLARLGPVPPHDPAEFELERLARLRDAIASVAEIVAGDRLPSAGELADLNDFLGGVAVSEEIVAAGGGFTLEATPLSAGWETIVHDLAATFAQLLVHGDPARLRRCANPDCGLLFYDTSRSGTRRWHEDGCGTLVRVRRFRAK